MKTQITKLKSSKLFYNKWPYKVECWQNGASRVVHTGLDRCKQWCITGKGLVFSHYNSKPNSKEFLEFINAVEPFLDRKEEVQIRVEGSHFNLFCKDLAILEEIDNAVWLWVRKIVGPTTPEELAFMMSNGHKKILRDELPKLKYRYRVFFKSKFPEDKRAAFLIWANKYDGKIDVSESSYFWLKGTKRYVQDPFMYVEDDKMLSMAGLFLSGNIKKVEEFILRENALLV